MKEENIKSITKEEILNFKPNYRPYNINILCKAEYELELGRIAAALDINDLIKNNRDKLYFNKVEVVAIGNNVKGIEVGDILHIDINNILLLSPKSGFYNPLGFHSFKERLNDRILNIKIDRDAKQDANSAISVIKEQESKKELKLYDANGNLHDIGTSNKSKIVYGSELIKLVEFLIVIPNNVIGIYE